MTFGGTVTNEAAKAAVAMMEHALANPADNAGTIAAAGAHGNNAYVKHVIGAAKRETRRPRRQRPKPWPRPAWTPLRRPRGTVPLFC